jgi:predicted glycosyltransferase
VQRRLNRWLEKFSAIWVPDHAGEYNLGGLLSHPPVVSPKVKYIGPLSRFSGLTFSPPVKKKWDAVAVLSGPEPQRSLLESLLVRKFLREKLQALVITGQPGTAREAEVEGTVHFVPHLDDNAFAAALCAADTIYCRSGYSSLMDLDALGLKAILIPTPGQTEQKYLAEHFRKKGWQVLSQSELDAGKR